MCILANVRTSVCTVILAYLNAIMPAHLKNILASIFNIYFHLHTWTLAHLNGKMNTKAYFHIAHLASCVRSYTSCFSQQVCIRIIACTHSAMLGNVYTSMLPYFSTNVLTAMYADIFASQISSKRSLRKSEGAQWWSNESHFRSNCTFSICPSLLGVLSFSSISF